MAPSESITSVIDMLNPISPVAHQILDLADNPEAGASDLAEVIMFDPTVTANILRVCNSAYFGLAVRVDSVQHAVSLLGMDRITEMIIVYLATDCLSKASGGNGSKSESDWIHSVATAFLAKSIGMEKELDEIPLLFTATLLRDIGISIMAAHDTGGRSKVRELVSENGFSTLKAEREVYSVDHTVLGGMVADKWNFSGKLSHIIRYHHDPLQGIHADADAAVVYLSDTIYDMTDAGACKDDNHQSTYNGVLNKLGYSGYELYRLSAECLNCIASARIMFDALQ